MPAPWRPSLQGSPALGTPEVPKSWSGTLPDEVIPSQVDGDSGPDAIDRFLAGLAPGDPGYEQVGPERLSQTHFLHRSGSFDCDAGPKLQEDDLLAPCTQLCENVPCTQRCDGDSAQCSVEEPARLATPQPMEDASCGGASRQLHEDAPRSQLCEKDLMQCSADAPERLSTQQPVACTQLHEDVPCSQLCHSDLAQRSAEEPERPAMQQPLSCTQLYEDVPCSQLCEDDLAQPFVEKLERPAAQQPLQEASCTAFVPCTQLYDDDLACHTGEDLERLSTQQPLQEAACAAYVPCTQLYDDDLAQLSVKELQRPATQQPLQEASCAVHVPCTQLYGDDDLAHCSGEDLERPAIQQPLQEAAVAPVERLEAFTVTPVKPATRCKRKSDDSVAKGRMATLGSSSQVSTAAGLGHTLAPPQQGSRVAVVGDGWGSREGGYEALVTEADRYTFTVIATSGKNMWAESHVLKEHCIFLAEESSTSRKPQPPSAKKRRCHS